MTHYLGHLYVLEPERGIEPPTYSLPWSCSTTELLGLFQERFPVYGKRPLAASLEHDHRDHCPGHEGHQNILDERDQRHGNLENNAQACARDLLIFLKFPRDPDASNNHERQRDRRNKKQVVVEKIAGGEPNLDERIDIAICPAALCEQIIRCVGI